jgi:hypothetical protein
MCRVTELELSATDKQFIGIRLLRLTESNSWLEFVFELYFIYIDKLPSAFLNKHSQLRHLQCKRRNVDIFIYLATQALARYITYLIEIIVCYPAYGMASCLVKNH